MFIEDSGLVFIKSKKIKAFPCGRRRSGLVDPNENNDQISDNYYIPFDPEARLNTEANNRKHSGLNGFKQSYLNGWSNAGKISIVLDGYLFEIDSGYSDVNSFGIAVADKLPGAEKIFVNIKLADMILFTGSDNVPAASTKILRDQATNNAPQPCLDLYREPSLSEPGKDPKTDLENYYFYGLSFSKEAKDIEAGCVSLPLLDYQNDVWKIHEASRLPKVEHGDTESSVKIPGDLTVTGNLTVDKNIDAKNGTITAKDVLIGDMKAITLEVVETSEEKWQLRFRNAKRSPLK